MPEPNNNGGAAVAQSPEEIEAAALEAAAAEGAQPGADGAQPGDGAGQGEVYVEEIDLGNGQKATFEAASPEELKTKIFTAYREAVAKSAQPAPVAAPGGPSKTEGAAQPPAAVVPPPPQPAKKGRKLTQDEEFALGQEFKTGNPIQALRRWLETEGGTSAEELGDTVGSVQTAKQSAARLDREKSAVIAFRQKHPDFEALSPASVDLVQSYLNVRGLEATVENLESTVDYLKGQNLLVAAKAAPQPAAGAPVTEAQPGAGTQPGAGAQPGATTTTTTNKKPAPSGLFGKPGARGPAATVPGAKKMLSDAEVQKIAKEQGSDALLAALQGQFE